MSNQFNKEDYDWSAVGWGLLIIVIALAWFLTLVGQLFGVAWYWPWLFFGMFIGTVVRAGKRWKPSSEWKTGKPNPTEISSLSEQQKEARWPHLTTIPGKYTRKPCDTPNWIQIPFRRDYAINCHTHQVCNRATGEIIEPGYDPNGKDDKIWIELGRLDGGIYYVRLEDIVAQTLGRGHS